MLEDRYYMRQSPFDGRRSATVTLLIVNVACFLAQWVLYRFSAQDLDRFFALSLWGMQHGYVWQLLTYQFMHAGFLHLLFNCRAIYVFGRDVEDALGLKRFLVLYLASGVIGGMFQILMGVLLGGGFGGAVVGASAAAFGLAAAFAVLFPDRLLLLVFIIPLRAKYLLLLCGVLALLGILSPGDNIAHAAHLGGMVFGVFFIASHALDLGWLSRARHAGQTIMR
jgi:membrane associated rhomboid family serine protease